VTWSLAPVSRSQAGEAKAGGNIPAKVAAPAKSSLKRVRPFSSIQQMGGSVGGRCLVATGAGAQDGDGP